MAKVILICGKICSGKTFYTKNLLEQYNAVLLSCDEIESQIFHHSLGENHDIVAVDIQKYLHGKAIDIVLANSNVILDWGFWTKGERVEVSQYYKSNNIEFEWHYVDISNETWEMNITSRNKKVIDGKSGDYYVDDGLLNKIKLLFEIPSKDEIDIWYINQRV